jgi:hypothetical protein
MSIQHDAEAVLSLAIDFSTRATPAMVQRDQATSRMAAF